MNNKKTNSYQATRDFKNRIAKYAQVYQEVSREDDGPVLFIPFIFSK